MQSEHAHQDMNYGIHLEPKVSIESHVKEVAHKALSNIPGGKELVEETFNKGAWKKPYTLPAKRHINQAFHLGWG